MTEPKVEIEKMLTVAFELPGVRAMSYGGRNGTEKQLESHRDEWWNLRVQAHSARETIRVLRSVADELEKHLPAFGVLSP